MTGETQDTTKRRFGWLKDPLLWIVGGVLLIAILVPALLIEDVAPHADASVPILPAGVTNRTKDGMVPYSNAMRGVLLSYGAPMVELIRERYDDVGTYYDYRRRSLPLGGKYRVQQDDPDTLMAKLDSSATERGWTKIDDISWGNLVYEFSCYDRGSNVFCVLAFTDALRAAPGNTVSIDVDNLSLPPDGPNDFAPLYVFTNAFGNDSSRHEETWIDPAAQPIGS